jgi:acyl-CoA synthetase (AMP-forming)/AMP-acid ligase II
MNLARLLHRASRMAADRVAIFSGEAPVATFRSLEVRAGGIATALKELLKVERGDRVLLLAHNCSEYIETLFGCWYAGLVIVPINARLHAREVAYIFRDTGARVCFSSADLVETAAAAAAQAASAIRIVELGSAEYSRMRSSPAAAMADVDSEEAAWLFYTSGTTGRPKGAILTHRNLLAMTLAYLADVDSVAGTDAILHAAPMSHGSGIYSLPYVAAMGSQVVPASGGFDPAEVWELIRLHRGVGMFAAPTMLDRLVAYQSEHAVGTEHLKGIIVGGAPFYVEDAKRAVSVLGPKVTQIYGQGESPMTISVLPARLYAETDHPAYEARIASVGYPHSVIEVSISDEESGTACSTGIVGEILVKGDTVMKGYWENPEATAAGLRDGWLHTGDLGFLDAEGFLTLKGRSKELIISGGSNIYPREVEEVLLLHDAVAEAAVVGRRHHQWGEEVVAFIVPRAGQYMAAAVLDAWCLEHIARYKRPRHYQVVESLPKNAYGKVLRSELIASFERQS